MIKVDWERTLTKRLMLSQAHKMDLDQGTSNVRAMEMTLDIGEKAQGICLQFFGDWATYGLNEALIYLENYESENLVAEGTHKKASAIANKIHNAEQTK